MDANCPKTVAVVTCAFKPPHKGHLDMVQKYADSADEVLELITRPGKAGRKLPNGREITAEESLKIWHVLTVGIHNGDVSMSRQATPIYAAAEYVGDDGRPNEVERGMMCCS